MAYKSGMRLTFRPRKRISKQLSKLAKITRRTPNELINNLIEGPLNQIVVDGDHDYMRVVLQ